MALKYSLCNDWHFTEHCDDAFLRGESAEAERVRLPHTCRELPLHYAAPKDYEMVCGYRRYFPRAPESGDRLFLRFDGAAHQAEVALKRKEPGLPGRLYGLYPGNHRPGAPRRGKSPVCPPGHPGGSDAAALWLCHRLSHLWRAVPGGLGWKPPPNAGWRSCLYIPRVFHGGRHQLKAGPAPGKWTAAPVFAESCSEETMETKLLSQTAEIHARISLPDAAACTPATPALYTCMAELLGMKRGRRWTCAGPRLWLPHGPVFRADGFYLNGRTTISPGPEPAPELSRISAMPPRPALAAGGCPHPEAGAWAAMPCAPATIPRARHFLDACDRNWAFWCLQSCPAGSTSAT